jgi:hypothetical protein
MRFQIVRHNGVALSQSSNCTGRSSPAAPRAPRASVNRKDTGKNFCENAARPCGMWRLPAGVPGHESPIRAICAGRRLGCRVTACKPHGSLKSGLSAKGTSPTCRSRIPASARRAAGGPAWMQRQKPATPQDTGCGALITDARARWAPIQFKALLGISGNQSRHSTACHPN